MPNIASEAVSSPMAGPPYDERYEVLPIGWVASPLTEPDAAPRQPDEGAPTARVIIGDAYLAGLRDLQPGQEVLLLTWMHHSRRDVLAVHPRGDESRPQTGVFATRSPSRPNPIGLHQVRIRSVEADGLTVDALEAVHGTPVVDIKPMLGPVSQR